MSIGSDAGRNEAACVLCGGQETEQVSSRDRHGRPLTTLLCRNCGLVFNWPIPGDAELATFYSEDYRREYKGRLQPRIRQIVRNFSRTLRFFRRNWRHMAHARTCVDAGAGSGEFLYFARALGIKAVGLEPNRAYADYMRDRLGLDISTQFIRDFDYPAGGADLVRLSHVLEHLNDPVGSLKILRGWMSDDGVLSIEVPNIDAYAREKSRGNIFHFGHIFNFNPWTIRACAGLAGLEEIEELRAVNARSTDTFFRKGRVWSAEEVRNPENASKVTERLQRHYRERRIGHAIRKIGNKLRSRLFETRTGLRISDPAEIGAHFVAQFRPEMTERIDQAAE